MMVLLCAYTRSYLLLLLLSVGTITCVPLSNYPELVSAAGLAVRDSHRISDELENELETEVMHQVALATRLEQAAEHAALKARKLHDRAEEAKLRAFEAVAQEQALLDRERLMSAAEQKQERLSKVRSENEPPIDPLMEMEPQLVRKRSPYVHVPATLSDVEGTNDADTLEALRILYLQRLLADQARAADFKELMEPSRSFAFVPHGVIQSRIGPEMDEDEELIPFGPAILSSNPYSPHGRITIPERILASAMDDNYDDEDDFVN